MTFLQVLDPSAESAVPRLTPARRLSELRHQLIWFLDAQGEHWGKGVPIMNPIFRTWKDRLEREFSIRSKYACTEQFTSPFRHGKQTFEQVAGEAAAVIGGLACCGSGTSALIHDAVAYEQRGIPTVSLVTESVVGHAKAATIKLGMPDLRMLSISHNVHMFAPVVTLEESQQAAEALYSALLQALVGG
jgi:hypothetical protein